MFARVTYLPRRRRRQAPGGLSERHGPLEQMDGFSHAYFMVDRASDKAMSITIWESEQALSASVAGADEMRKQGAETGGGSIESVDHYEIITVGSPTTAA